MSRHAFWATALVVVLGLAACDFGEPEAARSDPDLESLPHVLLEEYRRVGSLDDPDHGFSRIGSVSVDQEGHLVVFEAMERQVRVYDADTRLVRRIGGPGQGPGEINPDGPVTVGVSGDTVWVVEHVPRRLTLFTVEGQVLSVGRVEEVAASLHWPGLRSVVLPQAKGPDGLFVGDLVRPTSVPSTAYRSEPVESVQVPRVRFDATGTVVDTIGWYTLARPELTEPQIIDVGSSRHIVPAPPSSDPLSIGLPDGRVEVTRSVPERGVTPTFSVTRFGLGADTIFSRTYSYSPVGYSPAQLDSIASQAARITDNAVMTTSTGQVEFIERHASDSAAARRAIRASLAFPEFQPPVQAYHVGENWLWLRREDTGEATVSWIILDLTNGVPREQARLPRDQEIVWSNASMLWAIERDPFDIPWLVGYRLLREPQ